MAPLIRRQVGFAGLLGNHFKASRADGFINTGFACFAQEWKPFFVGHRLAAHLCDQGPGNRIFPLCLLSVGSISNITSKWLSRCEVRSFAAKPREQLLSGIRIWRTHLSSVYNRHSA